jgi:hypothetical protein
VGFGLWGVRGIGVVKQKAGSLEFLEEARMPEGYLVEMLEREHEACRRLVRMPFLSERLYGSLGLQSSFCWFLLQISMEHLVPSMRGDVDILAGALSWTDPGTFATLVSEERANHSDWHISRNYEMAALRLARAGGMKWPPSTDLLVGVEAKCAYWDSDTIGMSGGALKSAKASVAKTRKIRRQAGTLLEIGLNHVVLLDMIANPPVSGPDGGAWISALGAATESTGAMSEILDQRLSQDCEAGHWVWSIGSVAGGDEFHRGAGAPIELRSSRGNSRLKGSVETKSMRQEMEQKLTRMLSEFPRPLGFPAIFVDCKHCGSLHVLPWDGTGCDAT